jgi:PiT family inorganic phosphate transporter
MIAILWLVRRKTPRQVDKLFRNLQLLSAAGVSFAHGGNDAQKTMGIVAGALFTAGYMSKQQFETTWGHFHWPIILAANGAIALGTYFGGWRIVHTMGSRITHLKPMQGSCAETGGAITLFLATGLGIPVSTTHTITGAIVGVGAARRTAAVRWHVANDIVIAWIVTIPAAAVVGALAYELARAL